MSSNGIFRLREPEFKQWKDYYLDNINMMPEEFDSVTKQKNAILTQQRTDDVIESCVEFLADLEDCKKKNNISFINCIDFHRQYHYCVSENTRKWDRHLKYYLWKNKESYMKYWEDMAQKQLNNEIKQ